MFYTFRQNSSRGSYLGPVLVCVQCDSHSEANDEAERHGLQFGMANSCPCCGPRWSCADEEDSPDLTKTPTYYGNPLTKSGKSWEIYYRDGLRFSGGRTDGRG